MTRAILAGLATAMLIPVTMVAIVGGIVAGALAVQLPGMGKCPTEDSVNCYWDADTMGNGHGNSYVTWNVGETQFTLYL